MRAVASNLSRLMVLCVPLAAGCSPSDSPPGTAHRGGAGPVFDDPDDDPRRCKPGIGTTGSPRTIEQAVALANSLPFPVTAECFVEALDRPLPIEATSSQSSVQPAVGARSPRVFAWPSESLIVALAVDGNGRDLIEFGELLSRRRSIKAELAFPLEARATTEQAHARVRNEEFPRITTCFVCHDREEEVPKVPGGRSSLLLRPRKSTLVDIATLATEHERCDPEAEPGRCRYLTALVGHGPLEHHPFDEDLPAM